MTDEHHTTAPASSPVYASPRACRAGLWSAAATLLGILLSGPVAVALVQATRPQPPWQDGALFARSYHPVQLLPYAGGILLVAALVLLVSSIHAMARDGQKALSGAGLVLTAAFAALIFFNYVSQTTFLPVLAASQDAASVALIGAFSMANPRSLAWGIEMWSWGLFGAATWLVAPVFRGSRLERAAALTFIANGPVSIAGALWTVARPGWVMTPAGLAAFALWNALLAAMAILALLAFRRRLQGHADSAERPATGPAGSPQPAPTWQGDPRSAPSRA